MLKNLFVLSLLLISALTFVGCGSEEAEPEKKEAAAPVKAEPTVTYGQGVYDLEGSEPETWRWLSSESTIKLKTTGKDATLRLVLDVPMDRIKTAPTVAVNINGQLLEQFVAGPRVEKEFKVTASQQGSGPTADLTITTNKTFVPKQFDAKSTDERVLGLSLRKLSWQ